MFYCVIVLFDGVLVPLVFIVCSLEIYMGCGNKVITPKLSEGQELDGSLILKVFKLKALYVKPSRPLLLVRLLIFFFYDFFPFPYGLPYRVLVYLRPYTVVLISLHTPCRMCKMLITKTK